MDDGLLAAIARVAHEANRAWCMACGDATQPSWDDAPAWQRDSALAGVQFHLDNPDASPSASHEAWARHKHAEGWSWGPVKDAGNKRHPCLVPFAELPVEQRAKDHIFRAAVHAIRDAHR